MRQIDTLPPVEIVFSKRLDYDQSQKIASKLFVDSWAKKGNAKNCINDFDRNAEIIQLDTDADTFYLVAISMDSHGQLIILEDN